MVLALVWLPRSHLHGGPLHAGRRPHVYGAVPGTTFSAVVLDLRDTSSRRVRIGAVKLGARGLTVVGTKRLVLPGHSTRWLIARLRVQKLGPKIVVRTVRVDYHVDYWLGLHLPYRKRFATTFAVCPHARAASQLGSCAVPTRG